MEAVAASYDARVEELDGLVAEHEQVKSDERRIHVGLKLPARKRRGGKDQHCTGQPIRSNGFIGRCYADARQAARVNCPV